MVLWLLLHFAIGLAGTWIARLYAVRRELIDHPGERRSHQVPTPRGGGIAIVIAILVAACVLGWQQPRQIVLIAGFVVGLLLIAGIGLADDHRPLSPWLRLGVQAIAGAVFGLAVAAVTGSLPLAVFALVATLVLTNVWNFMDGINGLAASQAALVAVGLAFFVGGSWAWIALALAAACMGFLPFNFPRSRIFLGDVGSGALGFVLAALVVVAVAEKGERSVLLLLPLSAFLVDSGLTLARRLIRGERWWTSHVQHAYQRWAAGVKTHTPVTMMYAGWTVCGWLLFWGLASASQAQARTGGLLWIAASVAIWSELQRRFSRANGP